MASAKSKKGAVATQDTAQTQHAVPSAIRDTAPSAAPKKAASLLRRFGGAAKPTPAATKTKTRPELELTPEATKALRDWVPAKVLAEHFETHAANAHAALTTLLWDLWAESLWEAKAQPENPSLKATKRDDTGTPTRQPDLEAMYV